MKLCDRCRVKGCLLNYGGKACREARKQECPDVVFTHGDKIREMDDDELAEAIYEMQKALTRAIVKQLGYQEQLDFSDDYQDIKDWLQEPAEDGNG